MAVLVDQLLLTTIGTPSRDFVAVVGGGIGPTSIVDNIQQLTRKSIAEGIGQEIDQVCGIAEFV